jgi:cytochrome c55X
MAEGGRIMGIALVGMAVVSGARAEPPAQRQDELLYRLRQDCGSCHGMTLKGGLGPALLPDALAARSEDDLAAVIVNGVPGTPMPPWDFEITGDEARWLARQLKQGLDDAG